MADIFSARRGSSIYNGNDRDAAIELRRLHVLNAELLEALQGLHDDTADYIKRNRLTGMNNYWMVAARSAIAKAVQP